MPVAIALLSIAACTTTLDAPSSFRLDSRDARRFAATFVAADGAPTAQALQRGYLDGATPVLEAFAPDYIVDAATLSKAIAGARGVYRHAVDVCLPMASGMGSLARDAQLLHAELLPEARPVDVVLLFATDNTAGTVVDGRIVIGLEKACHGLASEEALRERLRALIAHEWVHTQQPQQTEADRHDLLAWALREGVASYLAALALGEDGSASEHAWAAPREAELWEQFQQDRATMRAHWPLDGEPDAMAIEAGTRWLWNSATPEGRPADLGYWIGQRIVHAWFARQPDRRDAVRRMLAMPSVDAFIVESGYAPRGEARRP